MNARSALANARRIVIKLGSSVIRHLHDDPDDLASLFGDITRWRMDKRQIIVVSSGAVALGRARLPQMKGSLPELQALAAVGQVDLMALWQKAAEKVGITVGQVMLTPHVTEHRASYLNARNALEAMLAEGIIPVINENDTTATDELRYGDNDRLAAITAGLVDADLLIFLTNIDGVLDEDGALITTITPEHVLGAPVTAQSAEGRGGMASKVEAAKLATGWGIASIIARGSIAHALRQLEDRNAPATFMAASGTRAARRRWLEGRGQRDGAVEIDAGAMTALRAGKSLLGVGVTTLARPFRSFEAVAILHEGREVGFGLAAQDGLSFEALDGVVIHRDNLVMWT